MSGDSRHTLTRRAILKLIGAGTSALYLPGLGGCGRVSTDAPATKSTANSAADSFQRISPIDRTLQQQAPLKYSGDDPGRTHRILWDKPGYVAAKGGLPEPSEKVPLAIVGGGMSGLASAYLLRKHRPVLLERAERFGGNSRGESWRGLDYSIGAAYFVKPEKDSPIDRLIRELKLGERCRERTAEDPVVLNGKRHYEFWRGETDPARPRQFRRLRRHFRDVLEEKNGWFYPDIPVTDAARRKRIDALDK